MPHTKKQIPKVIDGTDSSSALGRLDSRVGSATLPTAAAFHENMHH